MLFKSCSSNEVRIQINLRTSAQIMIISAQMKLRIIIKVFGWNRFITGYKQHASYHLLQEPVPVCCQSERLLDPLSALLLCVRFHQYLFELIVFKSARKQITVGSLAADRPRAPRLSLTPITIKAMTQNPCQSLGADSKLPHCRWVMHSGRQSNLSLQQRPDSPPSVKCNHQIPPPCDSGEHMPGGINAGSSRVHDQPAECNTIQHTHTPPASRLCQNLTICTILLQRFA